MRQSPQAADVEELVEPLPRPPGFHRGSRSLSTVDERVSPVRCAPTTRLIALRRMYVGSDRASVLDPPRLAVLPEDTDLSGLWVARKAAGNTILGIVCARTTDGVGDDGAGDRYNR